MIKFSSHSSSEPHKAEHLGDGNFIRIDEGTFQDVEFSFKDITPKGIDESDNFHVNYDYDLWFIPPNIDPETTVAEFEEDIQLILHQMMLEWAETIEREQVDSPEDI